MGSTSSRESAPIGDISQYEFNYTRTTTNSELSIGNREIINLNAKTSSGCHTIEKGAIIINTHYIFEHKELENYIYDKLIQRNFLKMENKKSKKFVTSGSDSGRSITIHSQDLRKEIRCSERTSLSEKDKATFNLVETEVLELNNNKIEQQHCKLKIVFEESLAREFLDKNEPFCLSYNKDGKKTNALTIMTSVEKGDVIIDCAHLPKDSDLEIVVGVYDCLSMGECNEKQFCAPYKTGQDLMVLSLNKERQLTCS
ncbi:hypothetical protein AKO1_008768 [Acrasis kona]|uniref:Uncharacterized protein n=1 Tax=Acrasis kona TaxID=1008807 RepID=A0AAW2ZFV3_9EUKA